MAEDTEAGKLAVAEAAAAMVETGMILGLGSGSTSLAFVRALGRRVADGLTLPAVVATSEASGAAAREVGIEVADMTGPDAPTRLDLAVDGADEIDPSLRLLKGGGASLTREKIAARMADRFVVIVDGSKLVERLGAFALPVEVLPFGLRRTAAAIARRFGVEPSLRMKDGVPLVTDNGLHILDCPFGRIDAPEEVAAWLSAQPGVLEHGLFLDEANEALVGEASGVRRLTRAA